MSKKKKSGSSMAAAAKDGNPIAAIGMALTTPKVTTVEPTINPVQAKTNTLTSKPNRARGFFTQQANTARKYLLGQ